MKTLFYCVLALIFLAGCATKTIIHTEPPGAMLYINGREVGKTPCAYDSKHGPPKIYRIQIIKEGYEPVEILVDTEVSPEGTLVGVVAASMACMPCLFPFFAFRLADKYEFRLKPANHP